MTRRCLPVYAALAASASLGCSALLDLDVQYSDAGADGSPALDGGETPDTSTDGGDGTPDASGTVDAPDGTANPTDTGTAPGIPDAAPDAAPGAIAFVQVRTQETPNFSPTQTLLVPGVVAHDAIILAIEYGTTANAQITDTAGSTYQLATGLPADLFGVQSGIYYALDVAGGDHQITVTLQNTTTVNTFEVFAHEFAGVGALDAVNGQNSTGASSATTMESGFITTAVANELVFGFGIGGTVQEGPNFTALSYFSADLTEYLILGTPGMIEATAINANADAWTLMVAAFKPR